MNRKRYLLASDYDCTLYSHKTLEISPEDRAGAERFRKEGNVFGIVTGRSEANITAALEKARFSDFDFVISMNGTRAVNADGTELFEYRADASVLPDILQAIRSTGGTSPAVVSGKREFCVGEEWFCRNEHPIITAEETASLPFFNCIFSTYPSVEKAAGAVVILQREFGKYINPQRNGVHVDIPPAECDKGCAVMKAAKIYGICENDIFAIGDNMNGRSMVCRFNGYAMESGSDELKTLASGTSPSVSYLTNLILNKK